MAKNIPPSLGYNFKEILANGLQNLDFVGDLIFASGLREEDLYESIRDKADEALSEPSLKNLINEDTCATEKQIGELLQTLEGLADKSAFKTAFDEVHPGLEPIAMLINGFRLDCTNCLNATCVRRDPAHPVAEVLKRVPEKK